MNNKAHYGYRVRIYPTKEQSERIDVFIDARRAIWNLGVEIQSSLLRNQESILKLVDLKKEVSERLKEPEYEWLSRYGVPSHMNHFTLSDVNTAYNRYLKKISDIPRFKSKNSYPKSFVQRNDMKQFSRDCIQINKIGKIHCDLHQLERAQGREGKVARPTISYDGVNYYFSVVIESEVVNSINPESEPIGIDVGIRTLLTLSNGKEYNIDYEPIKHLIRRKSLISKRLGRAYQKTEKSKNTMKLEKELLQVNKKISDYQNTHIYKMVSDIMKTNPKYVAMENLNLKNMVKNRNLSKKLNEAKFRFVRDQVEYQCRIHGIPFYLVGSKFPSTKQCSSCKTRNDPKTSKTYKCSSCGLVIDRDLNASINIRDEFKK